LSADAYSRSQESKLPEAVTDLSDLFFGYFELDCACAAGEKSSNEKQKATTEPDSRDLLKLCGITFEEGMKQGFNSLLVQSLEDLEGTFFFS
jgi:hypothetical protein